MVLHELGALVRHLLLYYRLVLGQRLLDLVVSQLALVDLHFALVLQGVDLLQEHFAAGLLLLVHLV